MYLRDYGREHNPNKGNCEDNEDNENDEKHHFVEVFKRENLPALGAATLVSQCYPSWDLFTLWLLTCSTDPDSIWSGVLRNLCVDGNLHERVDRGADREQLLDQRGCALIRGNYTYADRRNAVGSLWTQPDHDVRSVRPSNPWTCYDKADIHGESIQRIFRPMDTGSLHFDLWRADERLAGRVLPTQSEIDERCAGLRPSSLHSFGVQSFGRYSPRH